MSSYRDLLFEYCSIHKKLAETERELIIEKQKVQLVNKRFAGEENPRVEYTIMEERALTRCEVEITVYDKVRDFVMSVQTN